MHYEYSVAARKGVNMIWITWRRNRASLIVGCVALLIMGAVLIPVGLHKLIIDPLGQWSKVLRVANLAYYVVFGILMASPVIADFENRTYRLIWTQSKTRVQWFWINIGFGACAAVIFSAILSVMMSWWHLPLTGVKNGQVFVVSQTGFVTFNGVIPACETVFIMFVALLAGILSRKTLFGALTALLVFVTVWGILQIFFQPYFYPPASFWAFQVVEASMFLGVSAILAGFSYFLVKMA
jgi:hypothetical protein